MMQQRKQQLLQQHCHLGLQTTVLVLDHRGPASTSPCMQSCCLDALRLIKVCHTSSAIMLTHPENKYQVTDNLPTVNTPLSCAPDT